MLEDLPVEVFQRVASFCPGGDLLSLSSTCRDVRISCFNIGVLRDSFTNNTPEPILALLPSKDAVLDLIERDFVKYPGLSNVTVWARLSEAASQLASAGTYLRDRIQLDTSEKEEPEGWTPPDSTALSVEVKSYVGILSTFAILGSPQVITLAALGPLVALAGSLIDSRAKDFEDKQQDLIAALDYRFRSKLMFCVTTGLIVSGTPDTMSYLARQFHKDIRQRGIDGPPPYRVEGDLFCGRQTYGFLRQIGIIWTIRTRLSPGSKYWLPSPSKMPFIGDGKTDIVTLPLPVTRSEQGEDSLLASFAANDSWSAWLSGRVETIATDIAEGEWCGYCATIRESDVPVAALGNIKFSADPDLSVGPLVKIRAQECRDSVLGQFELVGRVWTSASDDLGHLFLRVTLQNGVSTQFLGNITPFAITGLCFWDSSNPSCFWLWKKEWMEDQDHMWTYEF